ncbi:MAG: efflux RND transporter periplasmic adaptor subunit [Waddliaceae bacterium]
MHTKVIAAALLSLTLMACEKKEQKKEALPAQVALGIVTSKTVPYVIRTVGNTSPYETVDVMPQVSGELTGVYFKDGSVVEPGDLLFKIDSSSYDASLQQAKGQLAQAKSSFRYNQDRLERYQGLLPDDYVSLLDFAQYVSGRDTAKGQITQFGGSVKGADVNVGYCTIRSPLRGVCGKHSQDPGNIVHPNQQTPLVTINQIQPIYALFTVAGQLFLQIEECQRLSSEGLDVDIQVAGEEGKTFSGKLDFIDNQVDTSTGTLLLRAVFLNEDRLIWPGLFVNVSIHLYSISNALLVPKEAVRLGTQGHFLFVAKEDGTVDQRYITIGQVHDQEQVVLKGVKKGERVVTQGQLSLYPGAKYAVHTDSDKKEEQQKRSA